jgi:hypothetical protein
MKPPSLAKSRPPVPAIAPREGNLPIQTLISRINKLIIDNYIHRNRKLINILFIFLNQKISREENNSRSCNKFQGRRYSRRWILMEEVRSKTY